MCSDGGGTQFESQKEAGKFLADRGTVSVGGITKVRLKAGSKRFKYIK